MILKKLDFSFDTMEWQCQISVSRMLCENIGGHHRDLQLLLIIMSLGHHYLFSEKHNVPFILLIYQIFTKFKKKKIFLIFFVLTFRIFFYIFLPTYRPFYFINNSNKYPCHYTGNYSSNLMEWGT